MLLEKPTIIAGIAYIVLALIIILPFKIGEYDKSYDSGKKFDFGYRLLLLAILTIPIIVSLYSINCMVAGKCITLSYINAIVICIWVILFVFASIYSTNKN